jgi:uncharacterized membrane protein
MDDADTVPVPPARDFTLLGVTYGLYALGLLMLWPATFGLVIAYAKRGDTAQNFIGSHYRWLISTFWLWTVGFLVGVGALVATALPAAIEIGRTARSSGDVNIPWSLLSGAAFGGLIITAVWCWVLYRLIRGALRLADARAVP